MGIVRRSWVLLKSIPSPSPVSPSPQQPRMTPLATGQTWGAKSSGAKFVVPTNGHSVQSAIRKDNCQLCREGDGVIGVSHSRLWPWLTAEGICISLESADRGLREQSGNIGVLTFVARRNGPASEIRPQLNLQRWISARVLEGGPQLIENCRDILCFP